MKKNVWITAFFLFIAALFTQLHAQTGSIVGDVRDGETGEAIPFATIALIDAGTEELLDGTVSDVEGTFNMSPVSIGNYLLQVSFIGYTTEEVTDISITSNGEEVQAGTILLNPTRIMIDEVLVMAQARTETRHIDRQTFRATDFETALGGTGADLLNRLPSVSVDAEGTVSVRGTEDFIMYLNGRPTQLEPAMLLAQLSANSIESVDIISIPSARYDAQGKGGIININTSKGSAAGLSLSVNAQGGGAAWANRTDPISGYELNDNRYGGGMQVAWVNNRWQLYGSFNHQKRDVNSDREGHARVLNAENGSFRHLSASGMKPEWHENTSVGLGMEFQVNEASNLSASYYHGSRLEGRKALYLYHIYNADQQGNAIAGIPMNEHWLFNPNEGIRKGTFHTANIDFSTRWGENSDLTLSALYEYSVLSQDIDNPNIEYNPGSNSLEETVLHYKQHDSTPLDGLRLSVDLSTGLGDHATLSTGIQPSFFMIDGDFSYDTLNVGDNQWGAYSEFENSLELKRNIYAAYADLSGEWNRLNYKLGLRFEHTDQQMEIANPDYFTLIDRESRSITEIQQSDWFPSLHIAYSLNERDQLLVSASRRISRAPLKNMAPFLYRRHLEVYVVGDPELKPEYINNYEASYSKGLGNQRLTLTGFHRTVTDAIFRVNTIHPEELVLMRSFTNSGNTWSTGVELNANLDLGAKTKLFVGGSLYDYRVKADIFGFQEDNKNLSWTLKGNAVHTVNRDWSFSADFDLQSAEVTAQGENAMRYIANAAVSYRPRQLQGWHFSMRGLNLLDSNHRELFTRAYDASGTQIFYQDTDFYWNGPIVELSANYTINWSGSRADSTRPVFGSEEF